MTVTVDRKANRRDRRAAQRAALAGPHRSPVLVAAAVNVRVTNNFTNMRWGGTDWQQELWLHYDTCPEYKSGINYGANNMSRARLVGVDVDAVSGEPGTQATQDPDVADIMSQLFGGPTGQGQALAAMKRHLDVAGDCWVLATDTPDLDMSPWQVLGTTEVTSTSSSRISVEQMNGLPREIDTDRELLIRVWRSHPKRRWEADAPSRALVPVLRELAALTAMVSATVKSRLASSGILWLPDELTLPKANPAATTAAYTQQTSSGAADEWLDLITEALTAPIKDPDSASAVVPMVAMVKGDLIAKISHMEFGRDLDATVEPIRQSNVRRLAVGMNAPPELLLGLGDVNHWCVDDQTEILTQRGWLTESALQPGDVTLTLNHDSGLAEWQPVLDIYRADVVDYPMERMHGRNHDSLTTADHRWPVIRDGQRIVVRAHEMRARDQIIAAAPAAAPTIAKHDDALVELVAWLWTEGNVRGRICSIAQSHSRNPERVALIRGALQALFGDSVERARGVKHPAWRETTQTNHSSHGGPVTVFHLNKHATAPLLDAGGKRPTLDWLRTLTAAQLALFIDRSAQGDGQHYRRGELDVWQANPDDLDSYEQALILAGRQVQRSADGRRLGVWSSSVRTPRRVTPTVEQYTGTVWCPTTPNSTWLARRNGSVYFTGNTGWLITEEYARAWLAPDLEIICDALTRYYLHPALRARGKSPHLYAVGFDLDALTPKQVSVDNAEKAYDAGLLAEVEYMAALGFSEAQMVTPAERLMRVVLTLVEKGLVDAVADLAPMVAAMLGTAPPPNMPVIEAVPTGGTGGGASPPGGDAAIPAADTVPANSPPALTPPPAGESGVSAPVLAGVS